MVHTWYTQTGSGNHKSLILKNNTLHLVRVRVPLSAHDISDLAQKTWYTLVHTWLNGTHNGTHNRDQL
jgi:hypothetical protein